MIATILSVVILAAAFVGYSLLHKGLRPRECGSCELVDDPERCGDCPLARPPAGMMDRSRSTGPSSGKLPTLRNRSGYASQSGAARRRR